MPPDPFFIAADTEGSGFFAISGGYRNISKCQETIDLEIRKRADKHFCIPDHGKSNGAEDFLQ